MTAFHKKLWIGLGVLAVLTPLGIYLPSLFNAGGGAWGEWSTDEVAKKIGFVPEGMRKLADLWKAPVSDYNLGGDGASMTVQLLSYVISGIAGVILIGAIVYLASRFLVKREQR